MKFANDISPQELERIERFLTNAMQSDEAGAFEQELNSNAELQEKTEEVKLLLLGISEVALKKQLENFHQGITPTVESKKNAQVMSMRRMLLAAASVAAIITLALWWFLLSGNGNRNAYSKYYSPDPGLPTVMGNTSDYIFDKAMVEYKNGEYDKAIVTWNDLLKQKRGNDTLIYFIGAASQAKKNYDDAVSHFKQIVTNTGSNFYKDACWYLGLIYLKKGDTSQAIDYIRRSGYPQSDAILKTINKK